MGNGIKDVTDSITSSVKHYAEDKLGIVESTSGLGDRFYICDDTSNLTAVENAQTIYDCSKERCREFGELMKAEAGHIETLGNKFENLDQDISDMVQKYFG
uniref:Uncharacterized protein n=1 Tax=Eubacterium cellulosolvens (strain ATCC 43171 / JCM 9499 / 6) TaxID=633697 RepID=I5AT93_EUBC6